MFLADECELAVACALTTATNRGDTKSLDAIRNFAPIQIGNPTLVGSAVERITRIELPTPYGVTAATFPDLKSAYLFHLSKIPDAVYMDEFSRLRIDFGNLTQQQAMWMKPLLVSGAELGFI